MNEFVTGSTGVTQSDGLKRLGLSEIIEIESSSAISDKILSPCLGISPAGYTRLAVADGEGS